MPERRRLTLSCSFSPLREVKTGQLTVFLNSFHSIDVVGIIGRDTYHHIRRSSAYVTLSPVPTVSSSGNPNHNGSHYS